MQIIAHELDDTEKHARILMRPGMLLSYDLSRKPKL